MILNEIPFFNNQDNQEKVNNQPEKRDIAKELYALCLHVEKETTVKIEEARPTRIEDVLTIEDF